MASLLSVDYQTEGQTQKILLFSNPNDKYNRINMTIKASTDNGHSWPAALQINQDAGFGYSCMTPIDSQTVGIVYEGSHDIIFQRIKIADILETNQK